MGPCSFLTEAARTSEISVIFFCITRRHNSVEIHFNLGKILKISAMQYIYETEKQICLKIKDQEENV